MTAGVDKRRTGPRNMLAWERGRQNRAQIEQLMGRQPQTAPPLTAKDIQSRIGAKLSERMIQLHMKAIRDNWRALNGDPALRT
jgi:hypothetical protein